MYKPVIFLCFVSWISLGCNKEGIGGKASISGVIKHGEVPITGAVVYIKYGANNFPGFDPELYDDQTTSASDAAYSFTNLYKGNYYLYVKGQDNVIQEKVSGGIGVEIMKKEDNLIVDVSVEQ